MRKSNIQKNGVVQVLNIGLQSSNRYKNKNTEVQNRQIIENILINNNINYYSIEKKSKTENTMIIYIFDNVISNFILTAISMTAQQDCLASYSTINKKGLLVGKFNKFWGEFNKSYFIGLNYKKIKGV